MGADLVWIRSERPDGHRSLWVHVGRWHVVTACPEREGVHFEPATGGFVCCSERGNWIKREATKRFCPTPTPEDLAWLRGAP